jgi:hypothetical protein
MRRYDTTPRPSQPNITKKMSEKLINTSIEAKNKNVNHIK